MSLEPGKTLGGVGALLLVIGSFVPFLSIVGIILLLIGMKDLANYYNDNSIYQNALYGFIFGIIGAIALGFALVSLFFGGIFFGAVGFLGGLVGFFGILAVAFVLYILQAIYYRKAFDTLATKTGEGNFRTAGLLLLIGAVLTIVVVGIIVLFIAWIFATMGFFSIKTSTSTSSTGQPPPPPPPPTTT